MDELQDKAEKVVHALYKKTHFSRDLVALYASRTLMRISLGALGVFLPIFFFREFNYDLQLVIAIFVSIYGLHLLLTPLSSRLLGIIGTRRMIMLGLVFAVLSIVALYLFPRNPEYVTVLYILFIAAYRALYWVPYHVDFSNGLDKSMRGRQLAILRNTASVVLIAVPTIGGLIISSAGFDAVFLFSIFIMVFAMIPLWFMSHTYERYSWGYMETFQHLFAHGNRSLFIANFANGAQGMAITLFWPIYIFTLLDERFTVLGIIASLTVVVVIALRTFVGKLFDTWSQKRMLWVGVIMATTGWVTKIFVQTPFEVFAADSYHNFGRTVNSLSFDATTYEQAADNGRYVDEYTALKEMALSVGRIVMLLLMAVLVLYLDMRIAFVIAAFVALFMLGLNAKMKIR
ncbi:MFS transporter [Candidatus Kaiserbacteria bacterium]|nr:MAG: MFS transporter [Candidatus Kaiserbacteria bacterium]